MKKLRPIDRLAQEEHANGLSGIPADWNCEHCKKRVPMDDTCIVPDTLKIICQACGDKLREREVTKLEAEFGVYPKSKIFVR